MFKKEVIFSPAWNNSDNDPTKPPGIDCVEMGFYLTGPLGVVQYKASTGWYLAGSVKPNEYFKVKKMHSMDSYINKRAGTEICGDMFMNVDLGYHSYKPMHEDHMCIDQECPLLGGKPCYYDGSSMSSERVFDILVHQGSDGVWKYLEEFYNETFLGDE